jgi:hypothetical protein
MLEIALGLPDSKLREERSGKRREKEVMRKEFRQPKEEIVRATRRIKKGNMGKRKESLTKNAKRIINLNSRKNKPKSTSCRLKPFIEVNSKE